MKLLFFIFFFFTYNLFAQINKAIEEFDKKNYREAYKLFIKENFNENPISFYYLGIMNEKGLGIEIDTQKAVELYERGSELNEKNCLYIMGLIYLNGLYNKPSDIDKALYLLNKSDKEGKTEATLKLGEIYYYGYL